MSRVVVGFVIAFALFLIWQAHPGPIEGDYFLKVDSICLKRNEDCNIRPEINDDGWASIDVRLDSRYYWYRVQRSNGTFEKVTKGCSLLTTSVDTKRTVQVYLKGHDELFSTHYINIFPRG